MVATDSGVEAGVGEEDGGWLLVGVVLVAGGAAVVVEAPVGSGEGESDVTGDVLVLTPDNGDRVSNESGAAVFSGMQDKVNAAAIRSITDKDHTALLFIAFTSFF